MKALIAITILLCSYFQLASQNPEFLQHRNNNNVNPQLKPECDISQRDIHCFIKGTPITMCNDSVKTIETLVPGDTIATWNPKSKSLEPAIIEQLEKTAHNELVRYYFESSKTITVTQDHPFLLKDKGWCSLRPDLSSIYKGFQSIKQLEPGDIFLSIINQQITDDQITQIAFLKKPQETYTISRLSSGSNFIANGYIVGVEQLSSEAIASTYKFTIQVDKEESNFPSSVFVKIENHRDHLSLSNFLLFIYSDSESYCGTVEQFRYNSSPLVLGKDSILAKNLYLNDFEFKSLKSAEIKELSKIKQTISNCDEYRIVATFFDPSRRNNPYESNLNRRSNMLKIKTK
ncbi:hypothetical protein EYV94_26390 [Puteibacter caeruleilacunae]|nr:hypothetical protein EYV94_26390 [Puteibacter caeruleilacunae]